MVHQTEQVGGVPDLAGDVRRTRFHYHPGSWADLKIELNSKARNGLSKSWLTPSIRFTT
jgi:hypothetical protein